MSEPREAYNITNDNGASVSFVTRQKKSLEGIDTRKLRAYSRLVQCVVGALSALYELITNEEAPKLRDVLRGHAVPGRDIDVT